MKRLEDSLQDRYAPDSVCFGCGPSNKNGLRIKSRPEGDYVVADFKPKKYHHAFDGYLSGGIISVLMDCHSNWSGAYFIMKKRGIDKIPPTVTAQYTVTFLKPTPIDGRIRFRSRAVNVYDNKVEVETELYANDVVTAKATGVFVAVKEGHPAYDRWG